MEIKIETGVPLPQSRQYARCKYAGVTAAARSMKPGESFFVAANGPKECRRAGVRIMQICRSNRMNGAKFATRSVEGGVRVWRLA